MEIDTTIEIDDDRNVPVVDTPERSEAVTTALARDGELTDAEVDDILAATRYGDRVDSGPLLAPEQSDRRGDPTARKVQAALRRAEGSEAGATPREVAAWVEVTDAAARWREARALLEAIPVEQAEENAEHDRVAAEQIRAGQPVKLPEAQPWAVIERTRAAMVRVAAEQVLEQRRAFDELTEVERPKRIAAAVKAMRAAKSAADKLVPEAAAAFEKWRAAVEHAHAAVIAVEGQDSAYAVHAGLVAEDHRRVLRVGQQAPTAMLELLRSEHVVLSGEHVADHAQDVQKLPRFAREALAQGSERDLAWLANVEEREGFEVTDFALAYATATGRVRPSTRRRAMGG